MKAESLQRMTTPFVCEACQRRHPKEKCASKCVRGTFLSAFIYFLAQMDLGFEFLRGEPEGEPFGLRRQGSARRRFGSQTINVGTVAERWGAWLSPKPMTVRVRSVP